MVYPYHRFDEHVFKNKVSKALSSVRRALDVDRAPSVGLAEHVDHNYTDKYKLANLMTNAAIVSLMINFEQLGLTKKILQSLGDTSKETTLRFKISRSCKFVEEKVVDVPATTTREISTENEFVGPRTSKKKTTIEKIVKRVTNQHYDIGIKWELLVYSGTDVDNGRVILKRNSTSPLIRTIPYDPTVDTSLKPPPFESNTDVPPMELPLTWLLQQIDTEELKSHFAIDDSPDNPETKTPSRNVQIEQAMSFFCLVKDWVLKVRPCMLIGTKSSLLREGISDRSIELGDNISKFSRGIFVPIFPLFVDQNKQTNSQSNANSWMEGEVVESKSPVMVSLPPTDYVDNREGDSLTSPSVMFSNADMTNFFNEQVRTLLERKLELEKKYPNPEETDNLISSLEAIVTALCGHTNELVNQFLDGIRYIESMLEKQLVAAIGKTVKSTDLDKFMKYHNEKFLNPCPKLFCYAIRQPEHYPDGILSIEEELDYGNKKEVESISTHVREVISKDPIMVPLNAVTTLALTGKTYLHGWLNHRFGHTPPGSIRLNARARQFSSFVLLVGTMTSKNHMQPKDAIILRNSDEIHIPLLLNEIPTATEFKDAIESLSPEQQRFAKSFRAMQLESSVLGVCVIQIKPQLEKLLGLPQNSLTKEIKLTEDLIELFVEYQVPSDLLSCDSAVVANRKDQVANVRENVKSVLDVIASQEKEQLEAVKMETHMERLKKGEDIPVLDDFSSCYNSQPEEYVLAGHPSTQVENCEGKTFSRSQTKFRGSRAQLDGSRTKFRGGRAQLDESRTLSALGVSRPEQHSENARPKYHMEAIKTSLECASPPRADETGDTDVEFMDAEPIPTNEDTLVFAAIPKVLDRAIELHDKNAALRSTTIKTADSNWIRTRKENLLSKIPKTILLGKDLIASEKSRAFDLLDALSRSGSLEIPFSDLHVVICATQRFEKSVMETVIEDNINPIEKLEMSTLLMASTILDIQAQDLIRSGDKRKRLEVSYPLLLGSRDTNKHLNVPSPVLVNGSSDTLSTGVDDDNVIVAGL